MHLFVFSSQDVLILLFFSSGYFHQMRVILEAKVPTSLEKSHHPPTPQADSIFSLIMNPIVFATNTGNKFYWFVFRS